MSISCGMKIQPKEPLITVVTKSGIEIATRQASRLNLAPKQQAIINCEIKFNKIVTIEKKVTYTVERAMPLFKINY